ncbi:hypothetical protein [Anaerocolumna sp. MB42-C2]|uniref:hypothetical protein n=1 Tax=Anaerocolumna sp. MB42-C2 TaxID=3070997 RepID=UPI0027E0A9E8|nr:hypothetical protein [Anaerocolumna sp. MB42-C2]WMJ87840.1 hypothetical protein RBU59_28065 [Anaerocolumna sp. MB42-C2]
MDIDNNPKVSSVRPNRNGFSHILDIIKAAFPYLDSDSQQSVNLFIKTGELMDAFQTMKQKSSVTTLSLKKENIDIEALLTNIRGVCYDQERELIDMFLNFMKAKSLYDTYSAFASTMASQSGDSENSDGSSGFGNSDMMEILSSMLTPEQKSTFDNINTMFSAMQ